MPKTTAWVWVGIVRENTSRWRVQLILLFMFPETAQYSCFELLFTVINDGCCFNTL
jgi:hypothetical protein